MRCSNCGWANPDGQERCQKCNQELDYSLAELSSAEVASAESEDSTEPSEASVGAKINGSEETISAVEGASFSGCSQCGYPVTKGVAECPMCGCAISNTEVKEHAPQSNTTSQDKCVANSTKATVVVSSVMESIQKEAAIKIAASKKSADSVDAFKKTVMDVNGGDKPHAVNDMSKTVRDMGVLNKEVSRLKQTVRDISPLDLLENHPQNTNPVNAEQEKSFGFALMPMDGFGESLAKLQFAESSVILNRENVEKDNAAIDVEAQLSISFDNGDWYIENRSSLKNTYIVPAHKTKIQSGDIVVIGNRRYIFE